MRESIGESWTIQIVAAFILLFVAFLALIISYSKTFKIKNEVISIIEKYEGPTEEALAIVSNYLKAANYKGSGNIIAGYKGYECGSSKCKYYLKPNLVQNDTLVNYDVILFYSFNIPAFGNIATFQVKGKTIDLNTNLYYQNISDWT